MIKLDQITLQAGDFRLKKISLEIPTGQCGVLMGKTGCGKTTLLEAICGLQPVLTGSITLMNRVVTHLRPAERGIGYVPQDIALFSTMTVYQQLALGPRVQKWSSEDTKIHVHELAEDLGIAHLLNRKPTGLSGGERQRVAIGRALSPRPSVLCMDEPLSALDDDTHSEISSMIKRITQSRGITSLLITHNKPEAKKLGDCFYVLDQGAVREGV